MAFGGVATGSIKAQLAAIATAAVTNKGSKLDCRATAATTGKKGSSCGHIRSQFS